MKQVVQARSKSAVVSHNETESEMDKQKCEVANLRFMVVKDSRKINGNMENWKTEGEKNAVLDS